MATVLLGITLLVLLAALERWVLRWHVSQRLGDHLPERPTPT